MMANIKNYDLMHMWLRKKLCYFTMNNEESDPGIVDIVLILSMRVKPF